MPYNYADIEKKSWVINYLLIIFTESQIVAHLGRYHAAPCSGKEQWIGQLNRVYRINNSTANNHD